MLKKYTIKNIKRFAIGCAKIQKYANKKIKNDLFSNFILSARMFNYEQRKQTRSFTAKNNLLIEY